MLLQEPINKIEYQYNLVSNKQYGGHNQVELLKAKKANGYKSNAWVTFLQARDCGLIIKKGSKSVAVFKGFGTFDEVKKDKDGKSKLRVESRPLGFARVFNLDQTEPIKK